MQAIEDQFSKVMISVPLMKADLGPGDCLVVPWGNVVTEKTNNNELVLGLRYACVESHSTPAFDAVSAFLVPDYAKPGATVVAGSQRAFLVNLHKGLVAHAAKEGGESVGPIGQKISEMQIVAKAMVKSEAPSGPPAKKPRNSS